VRESAVFVREALCDADADSEGLTVRDGVVLPVGEALVLWESEGEADGVMVLRVGVTDSEANSDWETVKDRDCVSLTVNTPEGESETDALSRNVAERNVSETGELAVEDRVCVASVEGVMGERVRSEVRLVEAVRVSETVHEKEPETGLVMLADGVPALGLREIVTDPVRVGDGAVKDPVIHTVRLPEGVVVLDRVLSADRDSGEMVELVEKDADASLVSERETFVCDAEAVFDAISVSDLLGDAENVPSLEGDNDGEKESVSNTEWDNVWLRFDLDREADTCWESVGLPGVRVLLDVKLIDFTPAVTVAENVGVGEETSVCVNVAMSDFECVAVFVRTRERVLDGDGAVTLGDR
jgi:hypothetical protein